MLQHTGRYGSKNSSSITTRQHCSIPQTLLTWFQQIFTCSLDCNRDGRDGAFCDITEIFKNTMKELKRLQENGPQKCFQNLDSRWQKCIVAKRGILKEMQLQLWYFFFLRNKVIPETFWNNHILLGSCNQGGWEGWKFWHTRGRREMNKFIGWRACEERERLEDICVRG